MIKMNLDDFAEKVELSKSALSHMEREEVGITDKSYKKIKRLAEAYDYEFINGGVMPISEQSIFYRGETGFNDFLEDVYMTTSIHGGIICVSNVDEAAFKKWHGNKTEDYINRIKNIDKNFEYRILIEEGDTNFTAADYAKYKWAKKERFKSVSTYIYGRKVATIIFKDNDVRVHVVRDIDLNQYHRELFNYEWNRAELPNV